MSITCIFWGPDNWNNDIQNLQIYGTGIIECKHSLYQGHLIQHIKRKYFITIYFIKYLEYLSDSEISKEILIF